MKEVAVRTVLLVFSFAIPFSNSRLACAQQQSDTASAVPYASVGNAMSATTDASEPGYYPSSTGDLAGQPAIGPTSQRNLGSDNSRNAEASQAYAARSAWNAGVYNTGKSATAGIAGSGSFKANGANWTAGNGSFGLQRQTGGIWRMSPSGAAPPSAGSEATAPASASLQSDLSGLPASGSTIATPASAGRAASYRYPSRFGAASGFSRSPSATHGPNFPSRGRSSLASPYRRQFNSFGMGRGTGIRVGTGTGTLQKTSPSHPSLNDTLNPNTNLNPNLDLNPNSGPQ